MFFDEIFRKLRESKAAKLIPERSLVCDLGCGNGNLLYSLSSKIKTGVGVDLRTKSIKKGNISLIKSDIEKKLKLKTNNFDIVLALAVLEHLNNPENLVKEAFRILKRNGTLIITTPSKLSKPILEFLAFKTNFSPSARIEMQDHKMYYDKEHLWTMLVRAGFNPINIKLKYHKFGLNLFSIINK